MTTTTTTTENGGTTVRLNVGGHRYEVSRSLLELYPESMLARLISDEWNDNESNDDDGNPDDDVIFIDRNGRRFEYVLDFMRDHEVNLPMTESLEAVKKELVYYGLMVDVDGVSTSTNGRNNETAARGVGTFSTSSSITIGTPEEAGRLMAAMGGNMREELDGIDQGIFNCERKIDQYKLQKEIVKIARSLFERSVAQYGDTCLGTGKSFAIRVRSEEERRRCCFAVNDCMSFFKEKLECYGLALLGHRVPRFMDYNSDGTVEYELTFKFARK